MVNLQSKERELIYLLRLEPLLLTLLLRLLLRLEAGDPFLGDGDLSSFPFGDRSGLPFTTSRSGLDILVSNATSPSKSAVTDSTPACSRQLAW